MSSPLLFLLLSPPLILLLYSSPSSPPPSPMLFRAVFVSKIAEVEQRCGRGEDPATDCVADVRTEGETSICVCACRCPSSPPTHTTCARRECVWVRCEKTNAAKRNRIKQRDLELLDACHLARRTERKRREPSRACGTSRALKASARNEFYEYEYNSLCVSKLRYGDARIAPPPQPARRRSRR